MGFLEKATRIAASVALTIALVPAVALTAPQSAEAATAVKVEVTRANTGKVTVKENKTYKLGATATKGAKVKYSSSKKSVVKVSSKGLLSAKKAGKAIITVKATKSGKSSTKKIKVTVVKPSKYKAVKKVSVKVGAGSLIVGSAAKASVTFSPSKPSNANIVFKSSDTSVAAISAKGTVTAKNAGYATITATSCDTSKKVSVTIAVTPKDSDNDGIPDEAESKYLDTDPGKADAGKAENTAVYADDAIEVPATSVVSCNASLDAKQLSATLSLRPEGLEAGSVLIVPGTDETPMGCAIKVSSIKEKEGLVTVEGSTADSAEVYDFLYIDDDVNLSEAYMVPNDDWTLENSGKLQSLSLSTQDIDAGITNVGIEEKFAIKIPAGKGSGELGIKVKIDKAHVKICQLKGIPTSAELTVDGSAGPYFQGKLEGKISGTVCLAIPGISSGVITWKGEAGSHTKEANIAASGVYVDLGVSFSLAGKFGFECMCPMSVGVSYSPITGLVPKGSASLGEGKPLDGLSVSESVGASLRIKFGPELFVARKSVVEAGISFGVDGKISSKSHVNPSMDCASAGVWFATDIEGSIFGDNKLFKLKAKKELYDSKNSPWRKTLHFDDGKYVGGDEDCTWKKGQEGGSGEESGPTEAKPNGEKDFDYSVYDGVYGYGAYAEYIGSSKDVVVPKTLGGANVVSLYCASKKLTSLDASGCTELKRLWCNNNQLTSLDVSKCSKLENLECEYNQLVSIDVSGCVTLETLWCHTNKLVSLSVSECAALKNLHCGDNQLVSLDISECSALEVLICKANQLTSLDVSKCTSLKRLLCSFSQLTSLSVSGCTELKEIECWSNKITSLDVSGCTALKELSCYSNKIASLNVSGCTALESLQCHVNKLTSLDVSGCTAIKWIWCSYNRLVSLDVSECAALKKLQCDKNVSVIGWPR